jgi:hypothetical protein
VHLSPYTPIEDQRLIQIAEGLGLNVDEVRRGFIGEQIARKLVTLHRNLDEATLIGRAFETIYKEQCGQGVLLNAVGQQAVAPWHSFQISPERWRSSLSNTKRRQSRREALT